MITKAEALSPVLETVTQSGSPSRKDISACAPMLGGKRVALFGSYGGGNGEWMRKWEARCADAGIALAAKSVITHKLPDEGALAQCRALGAALSA